MSVLTDEQLEALGPLVQPFERIDFINIILPYEATLFAVETHNVTAAGKPDKVITVTVDTARQRLAQGRYLWIIDQEGLKLILEATPNPKANRGVVCHTNITGGKPALQGGELWFGEDNRVYINYKSGRYGASTVGHRQAVLAYFRLLGFDVVQLPIV